MGGFGGLFAEAGVTVDSSDDNGGRVVVFPVSCTGDGVEGET